MWWDYTRWIRKNKNKSKEHYSQTKNALILRILECKDNHFIWMYEFNLPSDDNLSERALRSTNLKMKVQTISKYKLSKIFCKYKNIHWNML